MANNEQYVGDIFLTPDGIKIKYKNITQLFGFDEIEKFMAYFARIVLASNEEVDENNEDDITEDNEFYKQLIVKQ